MDEAALAHAQEKRCIVISLSYARQPFPCGFFRHDALSTMTDAAVHESRLFLICSHDVLSIRHEPSIL